ncbi:MAG: hypothetical protein RIR11_3424 [Bacteroidota bacterium]|jgi:hypothetical protein
MPLEAKFFRGLCEMEYPFNIHLYRTLTNRNPIIFGASSAYLEKIQVLSVISVYGDYFSVGYKHRKKA